MPTAQIEADHYPELAENGGAYRLAEQIGLTEAELASATDRRQALSQVPTDEFVQSLVGLNSIMRGGKPEEGRIEDGETPMTETPSLEDKEPLLHETVDTFKYILSDPSLDDRTALRRAGLTLAGAMNYIHAAKNGNGRTGRLAHYFTEFGTERGERLFEAETYSAIGRAAVLDVDFRKAVDTTPGAEMEHALNEHCANTRPEEWAAANGRERATMRVRAFLDAMAGRDEVLTTDEAIVMTTEPGKFATLGNFVSKDGKKVLEGRTYGAERMPAGTNLRDLYENLYVNASFAAHVDPESIPEHAQRVFTERQKASVGHITLEMDVIE